MHLWTTLSIKRFPPLSPSPFNFSRTRARVFTHALVPKNKWSLSSYVKSRSSCLELWSWWNALIIVGYERYFLRRLFRRRTLYSVSQSLGNKGIKNKPSHHAFRPQGNHNSRRMHRCLVFEVEASLLLYSSLSKTHSKEGGRTLRS
jgi:hypothetical protein